VRTRRQHQQQRQHSVHIVLTATSLAGTAAVLLFTSYITVEPATWRPSQLVQLGLPDCTVWLPSSPVASTALVSFLASCFRRVLLHSMHTKLTPLINCQLPVASAHVYCRTP
jgi:hypothetical protein